jgi:hypothetical protein
LFLFREYLINGKCSEYFALKINVAGTGGFFKAYFRLKIDIYLKITIKTIKIEIKLKYM